MWLPAAVSLSTFSQTRVPQVVPRET